MQQKFCVHMQQDVVISGYNADGGCACLNCRRKECNSKQCRVLMHPVNVTLPEHMKPYFGHVLDLNLNHDCKCSECINASLYQGMQR